MRKIIVMSCLISVTGLTRAALIAGWNFNTQTSGTAPATMEGEHGGSLDLSHLASSADANIGASNSGTSENKVSGDANGVDFYVQGGTGENGKLIIFSLSTSGYQNLVLTYATEASGTGFSTQDWSYSTDGGDTFHPNSTLTSIGSTYAIETVNFAADVNNNSPLLIELTLSGATSGSGTAHFDNIQFNAIPIPEPVAWGVISGFGLLNICVLCELRKRMAAQTFRR